MMTPLFNEVIPTSSAAPRRKKGKKKVRKQASPPNEAHPELASKIFMSCLTLLSSSNDKPKSRIPNRQRNKYSNSATTATTASSKNSSLWSNGSKSKNMNDDPIYKRSSTQQMNIIKKRCSVIRWDQIINPDGSEAFPIEESNNNIPSKNDKKATGENEKQEQDRRMTMEQQQRLSILSFKIKESMIHEFKQKKKSDKPTSCEHQNIQYVTTKPGKSKKDREDFSEVSALSDDESITFGALKKSRNKALAKGSKDNSSDEKRQKEKLEENTIINALLKDCLTSTEKSIMDTINNLQIDDDDDDDSCFNNDNGRGNMREDMRMKRQSSIFIIKRNGSVLVKDNDDFDDDDDIEEGCILVDFGNNYHDDGSDDDYEQ